MSEKERESEVLSEAVSRQRKKQNRLIAQQQETSTPTGSIALSRAILPLSVGISDWLDGSGAGVGKKLKPYFRLLSPELTAMVIARSVLDSISRERKRTACAGAIGSAIQSEHQLQVFKKNHRSLFDRKMMGLETEKNREKENLLLAEARRMGVVNKAWSRDILVGVGMTGLMLMEKHTGMVSLYTKTENKRRVGMVAPTEDMNAWLKESYERNALKALTYEPMTTPPLDWKDNFSGGYLLSEFQTKGFVNAKDCGDYDDLVYDDCPQVFDGVNHIQAVPWKVNGRVLDVIKTLWSEGSTLGGLPEPDLLPEPTVGDSPAKEELVVHYRELQRVRVANNYNLGRRYRLVQTLRLGDKYRDEPEIYFPHHLDFRGRAYPLPSIMNPQGSDTAKGVLMFAEGKPINTDEQAMFFMMHGANTWGIRGTIQERVEFVRDNIEAIKGYASDPLLHTDWGKASDPFQFLAWCFEFAAWQNQGVAFLSHLPVAMDGSNNGLQLMSLLLRDEVMGANTNCLPSDEPADIYQTVADKVVDILSHEPSAHNLRLLKYGVTRELMKKPVMAVPYGANYYSIVRMFRETFYQYMIETGNSPFGGKYQSHATALGRATWDVIQETMPRALELMRWLKDTITPALNNNTTVSWTTPIGMKVYQGYRETARHRIVTAIGSEVRKEAYFREPLKTLSYRENRRSVSPNFIHSLDGSVMLSTANKMRDKGVNAISMVHDSFATHAHDAPVLSVGLREAVVDTFKNNPLISFDKEVQGLYHEPNKPSLQPLQVGELDINKVKKSLYFFH